MINQTVLAQNKPLAGVIRWDLYTPKYDNGNPNNGYNQILRNLNHLEYRNRIPFFGNDTAEQTVTIQRYCDTTYIEAVNVNVEINGNNLTVMNQEIDYAASAGLDYFAFLYYDPNWYSHNLYKISENPNKEKVKFCYILEGIHEKYLQNYINDFMNKDYQKVVDGRPLIYFLFNNFADNDAVKAEHNRKIQLLRDEYQNRNPDSNGIYVVVMSWGDYSLNADAFSQYNSGWDNSDRSYVKTSSKQREDWSQEPEKARIPWVSVGADRRPRVDNPMDWEMDNNCNDRYSDSWAENATPEEITQEIIAAKQFIAEHPDRCEANTFIIYAWNEHDEGGWICPTIVPGTYGQIINTSRLDAVKDGIKYKPGLNPSSLLNPKN